MKSKLVKYNCGISLWKEDGTFAETSIEHNILIPRSITTMDLLEMFKKDIKRIDKNDNK